MKLFLINFCLFSAVSSIVFTHQVMGFQDTLVSMVTNKNPNTSQMLRLDEPRSDERKSNDSVATTDTEIVRRIRSSIRRDDEIASCLRNIKVISIDGKVKISGLVTTEHEEKKIFEYASAIAGYSNVDTNLVIVPLRNE